MKKPVSEESSYEETEFYCSITGRHYVVLTDKETGEWHYKDTRATEKTNDKL